MTEWINRYEYGPARRVTLSPGVERLVRAFVEEHGQPTRFEIDGGAGDYLTCIYYFADGARMSIGGAPIEETS